MVDNSKNCVIDGPKVIQTDVGGHVFAKEQYEHILSLIQQSKVSFFPQYLSSGSANFAGMLNYTDLCYDSILACNVSRIEITIWIIDFGDTNHMTPHKSLLRDVKHLIFPYLLTLPNGYKVKMTCNCPLVFLFLMYFLFPFFTTI